MFEDRTGRLHERYPPRERVEQYGGAFDHADLVGRGHVPDAVESHTDLLLCNGCGGGR